MNPGKPDLGLPEATAGGFLKRHLPGTLSQDPPVDPQMDGTGYDPCDLFRFPVLTQKERRSEDQCSYCDFVQNHSASSMPGKSCPPSPGLLPGCAGWDAGGGATVVSAVGAVVAAGGAVVVTAGLSA